MGAIASKWRDPELWVQCAWGAAVAGLAFPPAGLWLLVLFAPAPAWAGSICSAPKRGAALGFSFGIGFFLTLMWWIVPTVVRYGGLPLLAGVACVVCLAAALAAYPAAVAALCGWIGGRRPALALLLAPLLWTGAEWARGILFTGLPWGDLPQALWHVPFFLDLAPWVGIEGVRLLCAGFAVGPAWLLLRVRRVPCSWTPLLVPSAALLSALALWLAPASQAPGTSLAVGVVQGNVAQDQKWDPEFRRATVERYEQLSREMAGGPGQPGLALVVWPETAMPFYAQDEDPLRQRVARLVRTIGSAVVFGAPAYERSGKGIEYRNAVFLMTPAGELAGRYEKVHLVPFGEYVPFGKYVPFVKKLVQGAGDFTPGAGIVPLVGPKELPRLGPLICFEGIFPELARAHTMRGAKLLIAVTNDGWFGNTPGPYQHLAFAAWRAAENGLPLVRAANTGVSAAFDRRGRLVHATRLGTPAAFRVELDIPVGEPPPAVHLAPWVGPSCLVLALLGIFAIFPALRPRSPEYGHPKP